MTQSQRKISFDYLSRERNPIECVHYFPTEEEAAIVGFEAEVDGRLIQSQVDKSREVIMLNSLNNTGCPKKSSKRNPNEQQGPLSNEMQKFPLCCLFLFLVGAFFGTPYLISFSPI